LRWRHRVTPVKEETPRSPASFCAGFTFNGTGHIAKTFFGERVQVSCPMDFVYVGPELTCSWVDRVCVGLPSQPIDADSCWNQYNYTLVGEGLNSWPNDRVPTLVPPPEHVTERASNLGTPDRVLRGGGDGSGDGDNKGRTQRQHDGLPTIVRPASLGCEPEPYVDLMFAQCSVRHSNLGGFGPDADGKYLRFMHIATVDGISLDLVMTASDGYFTTHPEMNGVRGTMGQVNVAGEHVKLRFHLVDTQTGEHFPVRLFYFTFLGFNEEFEAQSFEQEKPFVQGGLTAYGNGESPASKGARSVRVHGAAGYIIDRYTVRGPRKSIPVAAPASGHCGKMP